MKIVSCQPMHGPDVARLHRLALPNGFLSHLGDRFLAELYRAIDRDSRSGVWVAVDDSGVVAGFLSGTADVRRCYRTVLLRHGPRLLWRILPSLWSGRTLARLVETLVYPFRGSSGTDTQNTAAEALRLPAELLSIAVSETVRGRGVGRRLVESFEDSLREWDSGGAYRVVTDQSDPRSNAFYVSLGFRPAGSFRHHDHPMSVYMRNFRSDSPPGSGTPPIIPVDQ